MNIKKILYSAVVIILTAISVSTMAYVNIESRIISDQYEKYYDSDNSFEGYIFEDYNKKINLDYKDPISNDKLK